jgi:hypothetical protein
MDSPRHAIRLNRSLRLVCLTISCLFVCAMLPTWAGPGGKGGGGKNTDPPPGLIEAPVVYVISRIEWSELTESFSLQDVNASGDAIGRCRPVDSSGNIAILVNTEGLRIPLHDLFDVETAFPGWRFNHASCINEAGDVAGVLVPEDQSSSSSSTEHRIVLGNVYADPPTLTELAWYVDGLPFGDFVDVSDMNERGDVIVGVRINGENQSRVHKAPVSGVSALYEVELSQNPLSVGAASLNDAGQVAVSARISKRKTHLFIHSIDSTLPDLDLGSYGYSAHISQGGAVYSETYTNGIDANNTDTPQRWSPLTGQWNVIASPGDIVALSKAEAGEEALIRGYSGEPSRPFLWVYKDPIGTYPLEVTGNQEDVELWKNDQTGIGISGISRPITLANGANHGYMAGNLRMDGVVRGFILTPLAPQE